MRLEELAPRGLLDSGTARRVPHRQRGVVEVVEQLDLGGRDEKERLRLVRCRESIGVVTDRNRAFS